MSRQQGRPVETVENHGTANAEGEQHVANFPKNRRYLAAQADEVAPSAMLARKILREHLVLARRDDASPFASEDRDQPGLTNARR